MSFLKSLFKGKNKGKVPPPLPPDVQASQFPFRELHLTTKQIAGGQNVVKAVDEAVKDLVDQERFTLQLAYFFYQVGETLEERYRRYPKEGEVKKASLEKAFSKDELQEKFQDYYEKAGIFYERVWDLPTEKWDEHLKTTRTSFAHEISTQTLNALLRANSIRAYGFALKAAQWWIFSGLGQPVESRERYFGHALELIETTIAAAPDDLVQFLESQKRGIEDAVRELGSVPDVYHIISLSPEDATSKVKEYEGLIERLESLKDWGLAGNLSANVANALALNQSGGDGWENQKGEIARSFHKRAGENYRKQGDLEQQHKLENAAQARFFQALWSFKKGGFADLAQQMSALTAPTT